jgi:hypothetical protein
VQAEGAVTDCGREPEMVTIGEQSAGTMLLVEANVTVYAPALAKVTIPVELPTPDDGVTPVFGEMLQDTIPGAPPVAV